MEYRIIKSPSRGTLEILARRKGSGNAVKLEDVDAVGLVPRTSDRNGLRR